MKLNRVEASWPKAVDESQQASRPSNAYPRFEKPARKKKKLHFPTHGYHGTQTPAKAILQRKRKEKTRKDKVKQRKKRKTLSLSNPPSRKTANQIFVLASGPKVFLSELKSSEQSRAEQRSNTITLLIPHHPQPHHRTQQPRNPPALPQPLRPPRPPDHEDDRAQAPRPPRPEVVADCEAQLDVVE